MSHVKSLGFAPSTAATEPKGRSKPAQPPWNPHPYRDDGATVAVSGLAELVGGANKRLKDLSTALWDEEGVELGLRSVAPDSTAHTVTLVGPKDAVQRVTQRVECIRPWVRVTASRWNVSGHELGLLRRPRIYNPAFRVLRASP